MSDTPTRPTLVVAMLTYKRPDDLPEALPAVIEHLDQVDADASILIVDNDPEASAMPLAERYPPDRVRFVHEPTPGIAAARNRALDESADADLLVFIDDDERPQPGWLANLLDTWRVDRPAAVVGPVVSTYPRTPEPYIAEGGFFNRRRLPTGTVIDVAATNNLFLDLNQVRALGIRFDREFGMSGGSDTLFTRQLHLAGGRMVWCDEAVVVDVVPESRLTREWVLRRALRTGNSLSRTTLALSSGPGRFVERLRLSGLGLVRLAGGAARWVYGLVTRSIGQRAKGARTMARGAGVLSGAWGYTYVEYRRPAAA